VYLFLPDLPRARCVAYMLQKVERLTYSVNIFVKFGGIAVCEILCICYMKPSVFDAWQLCCSRLPWPDVSSVRLSVYL